MKNKLKLIEFIQNNMDWEDKLSKSPYYIHITKDEDLILFKYGIGSNFNLEIVQECRGLILNTSFVPVCVPFYKFGNFYESYVPEIDWNTAKVQEKVDGSIIKIFFYKGSWRIATNGVINAFKAPTMNGLTNFGELFMRAAKKVRLDFDKLDIHCTYMFELIGPENRIVLQYPELSLVHLGTRNNISLQELDINIGVRKPILYDYKTLNECIRVTEQMDGDQEGFVIVDQFYNRLKIKSPKYVALSRHFMNGSITYNKLYEYKILGELDEFLCYFTEYKKMADKLEDIVTTYISQVEQECQVYKNKHYDTQKDFALDIAQCPHKIYLFSWKKNKEQGKDLSVLDWLTSLLLPTQLRLLNLKKYDLERVLK